ncbi:uncharacterized protein LOC106670006 [Cimex lectularius]|uniref:Peptidase S1 domain-containing protein n=1 Tax=Cimex lectularius TaxID=79782 RepID=A0A8I6S3Q1_CIMLE|nr:uncharacterized protein LOC106670006 [Cimex lectularius]
MFLFSIIVQLFHQLLLVYASTEDDYSNKYQYIAKIINNKNGKEIICSGTVLTVKRVLTVADCVNGQPLNNPSVVVQYGLGKGAQNSSVLRIHFHHHFTEQSPILWHICLLKLKYDLQFGGTNSLGNWVNITNDIRTSKERIKVTALSFGRRSATDTYAKMTNILHLLLTVMDGPCPCFTRDETTLIYCSEKLKLNGRCGDDFSDAGGPVFNKNALEGILYALYSDELCLPNRMEKTLAPCNANGYAVIIPICVHKKWISSRVQVKHISFDDSCAKGNNVKKPNVLNIILFFLQSLLIKYL